MTADLLVLGVESSCDDTAAAVVSARGPDVDVLSNVTRAQFERHAAYGGVVPEIAARAHVDLIDGVIGEALRAARVIPGDLDAVAATAGPGLIGGVMVGLTAAKAIAVAHGKALVPVNHLEAHALSARLTERVEFPYLLLLISGGHTQLVAVEGLGRYRRLGTTIDDAAGEAFDKAAKLLGLGQPGGPMIERAAAGGAPFRHDLPRPLAGREGCDFSLSGLKTALRLAAESLVRPTNQDIADLAASFQRAVAAHIADRTARAMEMLEPAGTTTLVVAGGVAANCAIKAALKELTSARGWRLVYPPPKYCTDNGAMVAWAGVERLRAGLAPTIEEALAFAPRARWPLAEPPEGRAHGGGKKGPKS
jgi:N6-L-threonylcarbamoyladenine synthase